MRLRNRQAKGGHGMAAKVVTLVAALATTFGLAAAVGTGSASAFPSPRPNKIGWVNACGMPGAVQVRAWTKPGNRKTVVLLDGLRAQNDFSGWEINTNVQNMVNYGVNVVEPVGGYESWYSDWNAPDNFSGQKFRYMWNCVITRSVVGWMDSQGLRGPSGKYAIMGLSMGGNAALVIGANNQNNFDRAGSMSGYLNLSAPGMREAIRLSMIFPAIDGGTPAMNSDCMWGPPWSTRWLDNDPFVQINKMHTLKKVYVSAGMGPLRGDDNFWANPMTLIQGTPLELLAQAQGRSFQVQALINRVPIQTYFPLTGAHTWNNWQDSMWNALRTGFFN